MLITIPKPVSTFISLLRVSLLIAAKCFVSSVRQATLGSLPSCHFRYILLPPLFLLFLSPRFSFFFAFRLFPFWGSSHLPLFLFAPILNPSFSTSFPDNLDTPHCSIFRTPTSTLRVFTE
ncbi:unnamed protein product [Ectocarpus sp. 6 AP-2014]